MSLLCETEDCGSGTGIDSIKNSINGKSDMEADLKTTMPEQGNGNIVEAANAEQTRTYQHGSTGSSRNCGRYHTKGKQKQQQRQQQQNEQQQQLFTNIKGSYLQQNHNINDFNGDDNTTKKSLHHDTCISNGAIINEKWKSGNASCYNDLSYTGLSKQSMAASNVSEINMNHTSETEYKPDRDHFLDNDNDDWEKMFDESGECLDNKVHELTTTIKENLQIGQNHPTTALKNLVTRSHNAFHAIEQKDGNKEDAEFSHVLEASNFPVEFRTQDLFMIFSQYKESGFDIKWVDDTHALLVFSSSRIANEVLNAGHPLVILKPLKGATLESKLKAKKCALYIQPYRPRPETCVALARRLVTGALGVRLKTAAVERENEKRILNQARERKMQALQQQQKQRDNWDS